MMRIILADDDDGCRKMLLDTFAGNPEFEIAIAHDGAEAWWKITEPGKHFDLGIFDLRMPTVDGLQLIERVRSSAVDRDLPIILCTGINDRDTVARAARLAITHYIVKPYNLETMREKIVAVQSASKTTQRR